MNNITSKELPLYGSIKYLLLLLIPPFFGVSYCIYSYSVGNRKSVPVIYFLFILTLFYAYLSPIYDVIHTVEAVALYYPSFESLLLSKLSVIALYYLTSFLSIQCLNVYHLIFFASLYLIVLSVRQIYKLNAKTLVLCICCTSIVSLISLSFSTLASAFFCYAVCTSKNILSIKFVILLFISFLIHKSILLIAIPTIALSLIFNKLSRGQIALLLLFGSILMFFIFHSIDTFSSIFGVFGDAAGYFEYKANEYTGDGEWGTGSERVLGISDYISKFIQYSIIIYILLKVLKYKDTCKKDAETGRNLVYSSFLINSVITLASTGFLVLTERYLISNLILAVPAYLTLYNHNQNYVNKFSLIPIKQIACCFAVFFAISFYSASPVLYSQSLLIDKRGANKITLSTFYKPSFLLLDIKNNGFNDEIVSRNTI